TRAASAWCTGPTSDNRCQRSGAEGRAGTANDPGPWGHRVVRCGECWRLAAEAVAAVDGLAAGRAERNAGFLATAVAGRAEHLARAIAVAAATAAVATAAVATTGALAPGRLLGSAARRTSAWLAELAVSVELLVAGGEAELGAAVGTGQR